MTGCAERMQKTADPRRDAGVSKIRRLLQKRRQEKTQKRAQKAYPGGDREKEEAAGGETCQKKGET